MSHAPRGLLAGFGRVTALLLGMALPWRFLAPYYNDALVVIAGPLSPPSVALQREGLDIVFRYEEHSLMATPCEGGLNGLALQGGLLLVLALVAATPGMRKEWRGLGMLAAGGLFLLAHVLVVSGFSWGLLRCVQERSLDIYSLSPALPFAYVVLPALAGGVWCLRYWLPRLHPGAKV